MTNNKCDFCTKQITRSYRGHNLCELHYLKQNPLRNAHWVLLHMRDSPPWRIKDRIEMLEELMKYLPLKKIIECLHRERWFIRLREKGTIFLQENGMTIL